MRTRKNINKTRMEENGNARNKGGIRMVCKRYSKIGNELNGDRQMAHKNKEIALVPGKMRHRQNKIEVKYQQKTNGLRCGKEMNW